MNIRWFLEQAFSKRLSDVAGEPTAAQVRQSGRPEFGHYQVNGVMAAAKKARTNPREFAATVLETAPLPDVLTAEIAGPGFINLRLSPDFLTKQMLARGDQFGIEPATPEQIVVDYSAPNLAKEMHIGHLRSTSIGDAIVRILEFLGHNVTRANHVGDWGAQFGSLIAYMDQLSQDGHALSSELKDLEQFYRAASAQFKSDPEFAARARGYVVKLQSGDPRCLELWQQFIDESIRHCQEVYDKFNITLKREDIRAESAYNEDLPRVVSELEEKGLLEENEGAKCVFLPEFIGKDNRPLPAIVQKSDGGYPYMASDLAAVRYRTQHLKVNRALYVVGGEQQLHLRQVFAVAQAAGYITPEQEFKHLAFGMVLRPDGSRFKTREGADVKLIDVLDESVERAFVLVSGKNPDLTEAERRNIARVVGIGAVKYAELSKNRTTDYVFDWDTMLSFEGNTAPYLQYAYTRIRSIFRRAGVDSDRQHGVLTLTDEHEQRLTLTLLRFPEALHSVLEDYQANVLCGYLYDVASQFMSFYEQCPVLDVPEPTRSSRLLLCEAAARTLNQGLDLLGIETVERM